MKLCFVTKYNVDYLWQNNLNEVLNQDVIVFGFNGLGLVSYKKELAGETEYFSDLARLSKQTSCVIISGCDTDTYGVFRHSVVVADKGKLLGVSDTVHTIDESEFVSGGSYKVYETSAGKIGVIILDDIMFPKSAEVLTMCDADVIICIYNHVENGIPELMVRANAVINGIIVGLSSNNMALLSDENGKVLIGSNANIVKTKIDIRKEYHLVSVKKRGTYRENKVRE